MRTVILGIALLVVGVTASAQITVNSDGGSVRNSAPQNVIFQFPLGETNVVSIQMACSDSPVNHNWLFVYEETSTGIVTYPFHVGIGCNEYSGSGGTTFAANLIDPITVTTPDHTITIDSAEWMAVRATSRSGYYWKWSGGSSTLTIN